MKTATEIANHPKAQLHRELVARLRDSGSVYGAEKTWGRLRLNPRLWKRIVTYGLALPERRSQLNKIAFPACNLAEGAPFRASEIVHEIVGMPELGLIGPMHSQPYNMAAVGTRR